MSELAAAEPAAGLEPCSIWALIQADVAGVFDRDPAARTTLEVLDLNHHLMPDPVAAAVSCLLDRIRLLEREAGIHGCIPGGKAPDEECPRCDANQG